MKKRKPNSQAESSLEQKSPDKSIANNDESALEPGKSRNFADCEPVLDAVLNGLFLETRAVGLKIPPK